jgi:hypothetical protein
MTPLRIKKKNSMQMLFFFLVRPAGYDPATFSLKGSCSTS